MAHGYDTYVIKHGDLWKAAAEPARPGLGMSQDQHVAAATGSFAFATCGMGEPLAFHGETEAVRRKATRRRQEYLAAGMGDDAAQFATVELPVHPAVIRLVNEALRRGSPAGALMEALRALGESDPAIEMPRRIPD